MSSTHLLHFVVSGVAEPGSGRVDIGFNWDHFYPLSRTGGLHFAAGRG
ncbi:hypothetical protein ABZS29_38455 [Kribbella sp. NPDC005582]